MIRSVLHIEAPRDHVFAVLADYQRYKEWFPGCEQSAVVSRADGRVDAEFVLNLVKKVRIGMRFEAQPTRTLRFHMIAGKDLRSYSGSYRLVDSAHGRGTIVIAEMWIDIGIFVPQFIIEHVAKKSMNETFLSLRRYISRQAAARIPDSPAAPQRA
ncbi:MAG TPA: SRPBCC family protein [Acidobacteriota bacterium]|nr:SRPBCC family protein [Acidobacteriota bacterium]